MQGAAISRASKDGQGFDKRAENNPERGNGGVRGPRHFQTAQRPPRVQGTGKGPEQQQGTSCEAGAGASGKRTRLPPLSSSDRYFLSPHRTSGPDCSFHHQKLLPLQAEHRTVAAAGS